MYSHVPSLVASHKVKTYDWIEEVKSTGMMFSSFISKTDDSLEKSIKHSLHKLKVEGVSFNESISNTSLGFLSHLPKPSGRFGVLDLGVQAWDVSMLAQLLDWLSDVKSIHFFRLGEQQLLPEVWEILIHWVRKKGLNINQIDLGSLDIKLSEARSLVTMIEALGYIEKLDLAHSRWSFNSSKVFSWLIQSAKAEIDRFSLSEARLSGDSVVQLAMAACSMLSPCKVFSTGLVAMDQKSLGQLLTFLCSDAQAFKAVLLSGLEFNRENTLKLNDLIRKANLERLALIRCDWDRGAVDGYEINQWNQSKPNGVKRLYFERSCHVKSGLLASLIAQGYVVEKEVSANAVWLKARH